AGEADTAAAQAGEADTSAAQAGEADTAAAAGEADTAAAAGEADTTAAQAGEADTAAEAGDVEGSAEPEDGADEPDPVARFTAELRTLPGEWYVVHSYAGYENRVKANLESRTQSLNMEDYIFQVEVPTHQVTEIKGGKRQQVSEKVLPG